MSRYERGLACMRMKTTELLPPPSHSAVMNSFTQNLLRHAIRDVDHFTTQSMEQAAAQASTTPECEFLRLPPSGQKCPVTGLTRGYLNLLVLPCRENDFKPPVRSFTLRRKGRAKGVRLIDRGDLVRYIREHVEPQFEENRAWSRDEANRI